MSDVNTAEEILEEEVQELEPIVEKKKPQVRIFDLASPAYVSENADFLQLLKEFSKKIAVPSIKYESLHNYIATVVQGIYDQRLRNIPEKTITYRCSVAYVDDRLSGFSMFYLLPNRLPHIQTIDWSFCYTRNPYHKDYPTKGDIRVAYLFAQEVRKWKKIWGARQICLVATDEGLNKVMKRLFKRPKACGTWWVAEDIRDAILKHD